MDGNIEILCANGITYEIEDADCDGFKSFDYDGEDCDDNSSTAYPGAVYVESDTLCMEDSDGDGYGEEDVSSPIEPGTDCDDDDIDTNPSATEIENDGIDNIAMAYCFQP